MRYRVWLRSLVWMDRGHLVVVVTNASHARMHVVQFHAMLPPTLSGVNYSYLHYRLEVGASWVICLLVE